MMTRKHYVEIAAVLAGDNASAASDAERTRIAKITFSLADVFKRDNARFDRSQSYGAVSPELLPYA
jgi:predicted secreted Zn-dependent protease